MTHKMSLHTLRNAPEGKEREIYQLWDSTVYFLKLAKSRYRCVDKKDKAMTLKQLAEHYANGIPQKKHARRLNRLVAFLASAATRLYTISENYNYGILDDNYIREYRSYKNAPDRAQLVKWLQENINRYIHALLRDNIGHGERGGNDNELYQARQDVLESLTVERVYELMSQVVDKYKDRLFNNSGLSS